MMINIKNSANAGKDSVVFPYSNMKAAILETLERHGYIKSFSKKGKKVSKLLEVILIPEKIQGVKQISKASRRMYRGSSELRPVRQGFGAVILSTPKGILSGKEARKEKVGGEVLFEIW